MTKSTVSFALNGRHGVSEETRRRILEIARDLGWQRSSAASALSHGRAGAVGLVLDRPHAGDEAAVMRFVSGVERELSKRDVPLLLRLADDREEHLAAHREWWAQRRVDGVILTGLTADDLRPAAVHEMGLPAVLADPPARTASTDASGGMGFVVGEDEEAAMEGVLAYLRALGHRTVARVAGEARLLRTAARDAACHGHETVHTDGGAEQGTRATRRLLSAPVRPTAIVYDNDVMAVAGLAVAREMGVAVPAELSIVAWGDTTLARLSQPPLSAVASDPEGVGARAARLLLDVVAGHEPDPTPATVPELIPRGTSARLEFNRFTS